MDQDYQYIVTLALKEDIGEGDITSKATYTDAEVAEAEFIAREDGILAGLEVAKYIYKQLSPNIEFKSTLQDGSPIKRGQLIATAKGQSNLLLTGERTVLNFIQRMSGVASSTHKFVEKVKHTPAKILDTRKTMPGHRYLDKWAVRLGGGANHRMRLDDLFLIKENHIAIAGSIEAAIDACMTYRNKHKLDVKLEIEVSNLDELKTTLIHGQVDIIMLDNMSLTDMQKAVDIVKGSVKLEASGNISLQNVADVAETGVDYISVGAITHSARALDISLLMVQ